MPIPRRILATLLALMVTSAGADEIHFNLGGLHSAPHSEPTYSWALEYRQPLSDQLTGSVTWINEGHVPGHHRDGQAAQLWWRLPVAVRGPQFQVGLGPYFYYDTVNAANSDRYANDHGWGLLGSAEAAWQLGDRWSASLRVNRIQVRNSIHSTALVAGLGYRFGPVDREAAPAASSGTGFRRWELDGMAGATIVNSYDSDAEIAKGVSLRMRASEHVSASLTYLNEGDVQRGRRAGLAPQVWLEDALTERISVGVGLGPYFALRKPRDADGVTASRVAALVSITGAYAISQDWTGRLTWNRVGTRYDRDSDVILLGLGYRF